MEQKLHISVGIPAYNEQANIKPLLKSILAQSGDNFVVEKVFVISDASTDKTLERALEITDPRLVVRQNQRRLGQAESQNLIIELMPETSKALLLIEADMLPVNLGFISALVDKIPKSGGFSFVAANTKPLPADNFFELVMNFGFYLRMSLYSSSQPQPSLYLCTGPRLMSGEFLQNFRWNEDFHEDSYCYRRALLSGLPLIFAESALVYFKSVSRLSDYLLQSGKFQKSKEAEQTVSSVYKLKLNWRKALPSVLKLCLSHPLLTLAYACSVVISKINNFWLPKYTGLWQIYGSSKALVPPVDTAAAKLMAPKGQLGSLTVGIPAYNEERNIKSVVEALFAQKQEAFVLENIIVIIDGATDGTVASLKGITDGRFKIINDAQRLGKSARINQIFEQAESDFVAIVDADLRLAGTDILNQLVQPFGLDSQIALVSGSAKPLPPINFTQKVIRYGVKLWDDARKQTKNSQMYFSEGAIRAFRKSFYKKLEFPLTSADDIYPYLVCQLMGLKFFYSKDAAVEYALPKTYRDYVRQMTRFLASPQVHSVNFPKSFLREHFTIGLGVKLRVFLKNLFFHPVLSVSYAGFLFVPKLRAWFGVNESAGVWEQVTSTKEQEQPSPRKKIIISSYDDRKNPFYGGGGAVAVHETSRRMAEHFDVTVITGVFPQSQDEISDGVRYRRIGLNIFGPKVGQLVFQFLLPFYVLSGDFDLWVESFTPPFSTACLQLFTSRPVVALVHMMAGEEMTRKYGIPFHLIERQGIKSYKYFIVLTEYQKNKILAANPAARVTVIPNGVDIPQRVMRTISERYISFIGRIDVDQKGLDLLLQAYKSVYDKIKLKLLIAGSGVKREESKLRKLIDQLGLRDRVVMVGRVDGEQKFEAFQKSLFTVMPSRYETFSLVALESFAYSRPIISFDIPALSWIRGKAALKVKPYDVENLAQAMLALEKNRKLRESMASSGRRFVKHYTWDTIGRQHSQLLAEILENEAIKKLKNLEPAVVMQAAAVEIVNKWKN